jgi:hypothetical protein
MKNLLFYVFKGLVICAVFAGFSGCKFDDPELTYPYSSVLFTYQDYVRNIVVGEGLKLNAGIVLAGMVDNHADRIVEYEIDPTLVTDDWDMQERGKSVLPSAYYTLGHLSEITVPKGHLKGYLPIEMDSVAFLADPKSLTGEYILPIRLTSSADVDSIPPEKSYVRMSISYFGKQHGNYYYSGDLFKSMDGVVYDFGAYAYITTENESRRFLQTVGPAKFRMVADARNRADPLNILSGTNITGRVSFLIDIQVSGTSLTVEADPDSPYAVRPAGTSTYDPATRKFHLEYEWTLEDGTICKIVEDLVFRNRIRDDQGNGIYINEWR